jgi:hypothetical protein
MVRSNRQFDSVLEHQINSRMYYISTSFEFSPTARKFILDYYARSNLFGTNFLHGEDMSQETPLKQTIWVNGIVGQELKSFLAPYGCDLSYRGITFFICNTKESYLGNPHIDSTPDGSIDNVDEYMQGSGTVINSRFSVMILGNPEDPLTWWNNMQFGDERMVAHQFKYINGKEYVAKNIPGNSMEERWAYLGEPTHVASNVFTPSAFIKTDCAHTITCSPVPRLMLTVPLNKSIKELSGNVA